jgi:hypothetical protein
LSKIQNEHYSTDRLSHERLQQVFYIIITHNLISDGLVGSRRR